MCVLCLRDFAILVAILQVDLGLLLHTSANANLTFMYPLWTCQKFSCSHYHHPTKSSVDVLCLVPLIFISIDLHHHHTVLMLDTFTIIITLNMSKIL